jgi:hypothetical protein
LCRLDDPLLLYFVLYGSWLANLAAFNGDVVREIAAQTLSLAERQDATIPRIIAHRLMGTSLLYRGELVEARTHYDKGIALYDPVLHRAGVAAQQLSCGSAQASGPVTV